MQNQSHAERNPGLYMSHTETSEQNVNRRLNHRTSVQEKETVCNRQNFKKYF